jgi:hypothetical protein
MLVDETGNNARGEYAAISVGKLNHRPSVRAGVSDRRKAHERQDQSLCHVCMGGGDVLGNGIRADTGVHTIRLNSDVDFADCVAIGLAGVVRMRGEAANGWNLVWKLGS